MEMGSGYVGMSKQPQNVETAERHRYCVLILTPNLHNLPWKVKTFSELERTIWLGCTVTVQRVALPPVPSAVIPPMSPHKHKNTPKDLRISAYLLFGWSGRRTLKHFRLVQSIWMNDYDVLIPYSITKSNKSLFRGNVPIHSFRHIASNIRPSRTVGTISAPSTACISAAATDWSHLLFSFLRRARLDPCAGGTDRNGLFQMDRNY